MAEDSTSPDTKGNPSTPVEKQANTTSSKQDDTAKGEKNAILVSEGTAKFCLAVILIVSIMLVGIIVGLYTYNKCCLSDTGNCIGLLLAALCGALGAMVYVMRSFTSYWGNGRLYTRWLAFYMVQPVVGAALAVVFYFIADSKLDPSSPNKDTSINYLLGLSFLVGMFIDLAAQKLRDIIKAILATNDDRSDKLASTNSTLFSITGTTPGSVASKVDTKVTISGTGFTDGLKVQTDAAVTTVSNLVVTTGANGTISFNCNTTAEPKSTIMLKIVDAAQVVKDTILLNVQ